MKKILLIIIPLFLIASIIAVAFYLSNKKHERGALQVTSIPKSTVYIDGKSLGQTPLCRCDDATMLSVGDYTIKLVPQDSSLSPFEGKITISPSVLTVVDKTFGKGAESSGSIITLSKIDDKTKVQLLIVSFPDKADVQVDSVPSGSTPLLLDNVAESDHELTLTKNGYTDKSLRIRTVVGYKLIATVFLGISSDLNSTSSASPSANVSVSPTASASSSSKSPSATSTASSSAQIVILETPTGFLRVRDDASLNAAEIGRVLPDATFSLLDEKDGWYEIKLPNGTTGWVSNQYAKKK